MKSFKEHLDNNEIDQGIDESILHGFAVERKLKSALTKIKSTDDTNEKLDILMAALHFSVGSIAYNLQKK